MCTYENVLHAWNNDTPPRPDPLAVAFRKAALAQPANQPTSTSKNICN